MTDSQDHTRPSPPPAPLASVPPQRPLLPARGVSVLPPAAALTELALLTALILGLKAGFPDVDLVDIQPNPFWLPVLLLTLQYGTASGLIAAAVAIAVIFYAGVPEEAVGENHFSFVSKIWAQPILWISLALVLGQFRMRQLNAKQELNRRLEDLSREREALAGYASRLRDRLEGYERERAGMSDIPAVRALSALAGLNRAAGDVGPAFRATIASTFPGGAASVFLARAGGLSLVAATGWPDGAPWSREFAVAHPLVRAVAGEGRALTVLEAGDETVLAGEGLAAVPLRLAGNGGVIGLLKLETCEPQALTAATVASLEVIAAALALNLGPGATEPLPAYAAAGALATIDSGDAASALARPRRPWRLWENKAAALDSLEVTREASPVRRADEAPVLAKPALFVGGAGPRIPR